MRLAVTRPKDDSERTAAALRARGHEVLVAPLMQVEPVAADIRASWAAVIITSANAPGAVAAHPARDVLIKLPVFAVGRRSADAARQVGFADVIAAGGDMSDLVRLIVARRADAAGPLLYLAGEDRAADLIGELTARGIAAEMRIVYRATIAPFPSSIPERSTRYCISRSAAPTITWPAPVRPASPSRRWRCGMSACRRPSRKRLWTLVLATSPSPSGRTRRR
jgi:uroporphyrinogen-III synthase